MSGDVYERYDYRRIPVTIAMAQATSGEIDLGSYESIGIYMPNTWTTANLTFQVATKLGGTYYDLYDYTGTEVAVPATAKQAITLQAASFEPWNALKIRSGTSSAPATQGADRIIYVCVK